MSGAWLQAPILCAAFWLALVTSCRRERDPALRLRACVGLVAGALAAHLGWWLLHLDLLGTIGWAPSRLVPGSSVLFVPFGVLAAAPRRGDARRARYLHATFSALPLALALARVGCVLRGCCYGVPTSLPWGVSLAGSPVPVHPTAVYEIAGLLALHCGVRRLAATRTAPAVLVGIGLLRLLTQPLRAASPPIPVIPPEAVALALIATGVMMSLLEGGVACREAVAVCAEPCASRSRASFRR